MIPKVKEANIQNHLGAQAQELTINFGGKAFEILTDKLYEDKIGSLLREISSNAVDSQIEAGNGDLPIKVTLPTSWDNTLSIRDYGIGMDEETVFGVYSTLFDTTKDESNDVTGYIGIGSKAPFAYANTFTVTAYDKGFKRVYVVAMNERGVPEITPVGSFPAPSEPRGIEVSLACKDGDHDEFRRKAEKCYFAYDVKPEVNIELNFPNVVLEGDGWKVYDGLDTYDSGARYNIRQGSVVYPVGGFWPSDVRLTKNRIVVDVPMGSVSVSASRESLSMDEDTQKVAQEAITNALRDLVEVAAADINEASAWREAAKRYNRYANMLSGGVCLRDRIKRPEGEPSLTHNIDIEFDGGTRRFARDRKRPNSVKHIIPWNGLDNWRHDISRVIVSRSNEKVVRLNMRLQDAYAYQINTVWIHDPSNKDLEKLYRIFGVREFISASSVPDPGPPERAPRGGNGKPSKVGIYTEGGNNPEEFPEKYMWVALSEKRNQIFGDTGVNMLQWGMNVRTVREVFARLKKMGKVDNDMQLIFATPKKAEKLPEDKKFKALLSDFVKQFDEDEIKFMLAWQHLSSGHRPYGDMVATVVADMRIAQARERYGVDESFDPAVMFEVFKNAYGQYKMDEIIDGLFDDISPSAIEKELDTERGEWQNKYPLLFPRETSLDKEMITEYIEMCDNQ